MSSSALVALAIDVFLPYRASWNFASLNLDVADSLNSITGALTAAAIFSEPRVVTLPVGNDEGHAVGEISSHVVQVVAVAGVHSLRTAVLGHLSGVASKVARFVLLERNLHMEGQIETTRKEWATRGERADANVIFCRAHATR